MLCKIGEEMERGNGGGHTVCMHSTLKQKNKRHVFFSITEQNSFTLSFIIIFSLNTINCGVIFVLP